MRTPRILFFDIETAPSKAIIWQLWQEVKSMDFVTDDWYVLCWAAKWLGSNRIMSSGIYKKSENDKQVMKDLWKLLDEADIVVAHNAIGFDCKKTNTRFIANNIMPPSPSVVIDTLQVARKKFLFTSNKLGDLGKFLKLGEKIPTGGIELWKQCMKGDKKAWDKMVTYCKGDVQLLEKVYLKLRPFMSNHPNLGVYTGTTVCPKCSSDHIQYRGYSMTNGGKYRRFQCQACGGWGRERKTVLKKNTLSNL